MKTSKLFYLFLVLIFFTVGCKKEPKATTTTLHEAVLIGNLKRIQSLISSGSDVNAKDEYGDTPLHKAVSCGFSNVAELLIDNGADINARNDAGETPLQMAELSYYRAWSGLKGIS
ncbi:MAG: ankyrin repeat domain-containing protein [Sedimentisphaerales bacterium]|nr:ankyrin repeat domain-containing protein [Sedimentisphaerales bacterium]